MTPTAFKPRSDLVRVLMERGHVYQATDLDGLDSAALKGPIAGYIGFDATAASLHVGSLVQIMTLRRLQQTGHRPIVLMGGGTTKVGDPSDKTSARPMLTDEAIEANLAGIRRAFAPFLTFGEGPTGAVWVNNADWLEKLGYIDFLRDYGTHFTINKMVNLEFVRTRIENQQPLTFLEFNYVLMQAADFLELHRRHGCTLQFWRNTEDADVGRFLRLFTDLPLDEIARLEALEGSGINAAKAVLATEATALCHG